MKLLPMLLLIVCALSLTILLSQATWYPNLIQVIANNFDTNRFYQPTDQEYLRMIQDHTFCTKNDDCTSTCRISEFKTDCNTRAKNTYSETQLVCGQTACRQELFTYTVCEKNQCVIKGF